jgi:hypothetical protein
MVITGASIEDGYIERIVSLLEDSTPVLKLRAVLHSDGKYKPIVRDFNTGMAVAVGNISYQNPQDCLRAAQNMAINFIETSLKGITQL